MKKTVKRVLSIMLAGVMAVGLAFAMAGDESKAAEANYPEIKNGKTVTIDFSDKQNTVTYKHVVSKPSKVTFTVYTELSEDLAVVVKKGIYYEQVGDRIQIQNGKTQDIVVYCPADSYFITLGSVASDDKGKVTVKCKSEAIDTVNDREPNSTQETAMPVDNLKSGSFVGTLAYNDLEDYYRIDMKKADFFTFEVSALTEKAVDISLFSIDESTGSRVEILNGKVSKGSGIDESKVLSKYLEAGTYYIKISSNSMNQYRFKTDYVKTEITKIVLKKKKVTLHVGDKVKLIKYINPKSANGSLQVKASDANKVEILDEGTGQIKAKKVGRSKVTFTYGNGKKVSCTVVIKK